MTLYDIDHITIWCPKTNQPTDIGGGFGSFVFDMHDVEGIPCPDVHKVVILKVFNCPECGENH